MFSDVAKEGLKYGDGEDDEAESASIMSKFQPLAIFLQAKLKDAVKKGKLGQNVASILGCAFSRLSDTRGR